MKVVLVNKYGYPVIGGIEEHVNRLAGGLGTYRDIDVSILVSNIKLKNERFIDGNKSVLKLASWGEYFSMPVAPGFFTCLKKLKAHIWHFQHPFPLGELAYLWSLPPGKMIVTWHSDIVRQKIFLKYYRPYLNRFLERADRIIATSPVMVEKSDFISRFRDKCTIIPLGIDQHRFDLNKRVSAAVYKLRQEKGELPVILFIGRLVYYKGVDVLIRAMPDVPGRLIIVGSGPLKQEMMQLAVHLGVSERVDFYDHLPEEDLPVFYHACDCFVLPSVARSEAFGLVQLEAMACGKPVVSTDLPTGVPWVNQHRKTGLVVPPGDSAALAEAINEILRDNVLRQRLGVNARQRVMEEFTEELMIRRIYNLYREVLAQ